MLLLNLSVIRTTRLSVPNQRVIVADENFEFSLGFVFLSPRQACPGKEGGEPAFPRSLDGWLVDLTLAQTLKPKRKRKFVKQVDQF